MAHVYAQRGYSGSYVESLQMRLRHELSDSSIEPDGDFGPRTEAAVMVFQSSRYLEVDGIVGEFTDAALFGKTLQKFHTRPKHVYQGNTMRCWAAATASWVTTRLGRRKLRQEDYVNLLVSEGGAKSSSGALIIPYGQGLWEGFMGLKAKPVAPIDFNAELCARLMSTFGPLIFGNKSAGNAGHMTVMWGVKVDGGYPMVERMDPLSTSGISKSTPVADLRSYTGDIVIWLPTRLPLFV